VFVSLQFGDGQHDTGGAGVDIFVSIENLIGSAFNDVLTGSSDANALTGGAGNDTLAGGDGADWIVGAAGDDRFVQGLGPGVDRLFGGVNGADMGFDTIDYSLAGGAVTVQLSGYSAAGGATLALFSGIEAAIGSNFDDALIGDAANNRIAGGAGSDWLVGGGGDDTFVQAIQGGVDRLFGDAGADTIDYAAAGAGVTVQLSGYSTSASVTLSTFSGIENATGSAFDDVLVGNAAHNRMAGGAGSDWLVGQDGDDWFVQGIHAGVDRLFGDAGVDTIDYAGASAAVTVQLSGYSTSGGVTLATFAGIENAIGTSFNDALIGNAADNRITGGAGADWLVGGAGNDVFVQSNDTASIDRLFGDAGVDTIDYSGASAGVTVQLSGYAASGGATLATFTGIENAIGTNSNDALIGSASDNRLTGGAGADWLVGGEGADTFVYRSASDAAGDSIRDFSQAQSDRIDLSAIDADPLTGADDPFAFATERHAGVVGEAVAINVGASSLVRLYLDADDVADMIIQVVHEQGVVLSAGDFVL
jgi:Ca2+-binding RTX toxin-like protein